MPAGWTSVMGLGVKEQLIVGNYLRSLTRESETRNRARLVLLLRRFPTTTPDDFVYFHCFALRSYFALRELCQDRAFLLYMFLAQNGECQIKSTMPSKRSIRRSGC